VGKVYCYGTESTCPALDLLFPGSCADVKVRKLERRIRCCEGPCEQQLFGSALCFTFRCDINFFFVPNSETGLLNDTQRFVCRAYRQM
jgi:hypothetical protein